MTSLSMTLTKGYCADEPDPPFVNLGCLEHEGVYDAEGNEKFPDLEYEPEPAGETIQELVRNGVMEALALHEESKLYHPPTGKYFRIKDTECIHETDKALLVEIGCSQHWIPKSQIFVASHVRHLWDVGDLLTTEWFAVRNGMA